MVGSPHDPADRPDHVDGARAMFIALLGIVGVRTLHQPLGDRPGHPGLPLEVFGFLQQAIFLAVPLVYARAAGLGAFRANGFSRLSLRKIALVLLASLGTMWLLQGLNALQPIVFRWLGQEKQALEEQEVLARGLEVAQSRGTLFPLLIYAVVSPLCEETLFRGMVFRGLVRRFGLAFPLVITSLFFARMHETMVQFALMLVLGMFFGFLVHLSGSLWAGILAHAANNGAVLLLTSVYGSRLEGLRGPWFVYPLSAVVLTGALVLLALDRPRGGATSPR